MKSHISSVKDGAIITFPNSIYYYMKVCGCDGCGGVVRLMTGLYIPARELQKHGLGDYCTVAYNNLDELYFDDGEW